MKKIEKGFYFTFGDYGYSEIISIPSPMTIDFIGENQQGYGLALRTNIELSSATRKLSCVLCADATLVLKIEFKTVASKNAADKEEMLEIIPGNNTISVTVPELLSPLTEIVLFFSQYKNLNKKGLVTISTLEYEE